MRADVTLEQALEQIRTDAHSRLPVYREQLDEIIGMVHIKDVFGYVGRPDAFQLDAIVRKPLMVAPQMPVLDLLLQMRQARIHLALVVDEYGGIDGLVTIEDLVNARTARWTWTQGCRSGCSRPASAPSWPTTNAQPTSTPSVDWCSPWRDGCRSGARW